MEYNTSSIKTGLEVEGCPLTAHCWFNRGEEEKRRKILLRSSVYWRLSRFTACITFVPTHQQPANQLTSVQPSPTPTPTLAYYRPSQQKYLAHSFHYWLAVSLSASVIVYHSVKHPHRLSANSTKHKPLNVSLIFKYQLAPILHLNEPAWSSPHMGDREKGTAPKLDSGRSQISLGNWIDRPVPQQQPRVPGRQQICPLLFFLGKDCKSNSILHIFR